MAGSLCWLTVVWRFEDVTIPDKGGEELMRENAFDGEEEMCASAVRKVNNMLTARNLPANISTLKDSTIKVSLFSWLSNVNQTTFSPMA